MSIKTFLPLTLATMLAALVIAREPIGIWLGVKALATAGIMFVIFIVWFLRKRIR